MLEWRVSDDGTFSAELRRVEEDQAGFDSTGLLVLTQDGRVARQLVGEDSRIEKEYLVRVEGQLDARGLALLNHGLSLDDAMGCARYLAGRVGFIAEWTYGNRLATEMHDHARAARGIAWPRPPSILLGECTNRVSVDGTVVQCGTQVRAHMETPGRVTCRGCGKSDTIDGWMLAIVADQRPVTLPQLVPLLHKRLGIVISARTLQRMYRAGQLCAPIGGTRDAPTFDRRDVYAVVISHTAREKGA